jgi:predicted phosphoribosyltransferase
MVRFNDHREAGEWLARLLQSYAVLPRIVVVAMHRRAIEIALEVGAALRAPVQGLSPDEDPFAELTDHTVILVSDGFGSVEALSDALREIRRHKPALVIAAAPVASQEASYAAMRLADRCVCLATPKPFHSAGFWYDDSLRVMEAVLGTPPGPGGRRTRVRVAS